ncbi:hypothetical protein EDC15_108104 [Acetobacter aceti NBRC 14818]|nr:hypothetical protein EDC15_108104 [Acetobacter aceti NBRC 14818]
MAFLGKEARNVLIWTGFTIRHNKNDEVVLFVPFSEQLSPRVSRMKLSLI